MRKQAPDREWYNLRSLLGNDWALFYCILGARETGKSYAIMDYFLKQYRENGIPFYWLRLSDVSVQKMLANKAEKFVDADLVRKYNLELTTKGGNVYDHGKKMATVLSLSQMAKLKGVALFDKDFLNDPKMRYHICLDEFQREKQEKKTFDIVYNLVNTLENLLRSTKDRAKIFFVGNTLEEASDVLTMFNFIPEEFGRYKLKKRRCIIDYIAPGTKYLERRKGTAADLLTPDESTFTNKIKEDIERIWKGRMVRPSRIIKFGKKESEWFTLWDGNIIAPYKYETAKPLAMSPYIGEIFYPLERDDIILRFDARTFWFRNLIAQKRFQKFLESIKPRK
jgi:hypothetical protein